MKLLVIGKNGQLATAFREAKLPPDVQLEFAGLPEVDLRNPGEAAAVIRDSRPDWIVNCAAYTAVDAAEQEPQLAFAINCQGAGEIAEAAGAVGAGMVHISTDYVFDGRSTRPLNEEDATGPLNVYGQSKLAGEELVRSRCPDAVIVRTSWLYSSFGSNFVRTILRLAAERDELRIVDDQVGCPTSANDLAEALLSMVQGDGAGAGETYHFAGSEQCSWADFARGIVEASTEFSGDWAKVIPIPTEDYPTPAKRPAYTVLDCSKFDRDFGFARPGWRSAVRPVVAQLMKAV